MNPCSGNMIRETLLIFAVTAWFTVQAITITIDRADVKTLQPHSSMTINGWRPVTTRYDEIGVNVSPSTNLERNVAPLHPVINKLQEHMAASERLKPQRKLKPLEYNPPSILGSFAVFSHAAAKARGEINTDKKYLTKETKEYSFLIPPPRDTLRFEVDPHKKPILRDNEPYLRQPQFMSQMHKPDIRGSAYYIKTPIYSTTPHPMLASKNRPIASAYNAQPPFMPQRPPIKSSSFESLKVGNTNTNKQYAHVPKSELPQPIQNEHNYERYTPQSHITTVNGNFYNQVSHAPQTYKTTFERDPSFLVHESHEIGYVTPPFEFKFRHPVPFESLIRPDLYPSTNAPRADANKYAPPVNNYRNEQIKPVEPKRNSPIHSTEKTVHPTYYVAEAHQDFAQSPVWQMKQQYKPDINEVLPKVNNPAQFNQQQSNVHSTPVHSTPPQSQKILYVRPELQQQKQYQGSIIPLNINQRPQEVDFETPESLSLKHFNEQQFLLQQQLIEQDRRRLQEQEALRHKELEKHEQEEISKKQKELRILEQQQQSNLEQDIKKEVPKRKQNHDQVPKQPVKAHNHRYTSEKTKLKSDSHKDNTEIKATTQQTQQFYELPQVSTEPTVHYTDDIYLNHQGQRYEVTGFQNNDYFTTQAEGIQIETDFRKPQIDPRDPARKKKPTYDRSSTEIPKENLEIESVTEVPIQTTTWEAFSTTTIPEKIRPRKPGTGNGNPRRRRPSTTPEPEIVSTVNYDTDEFYQYDKQKVPDLSKRRRTKPQTNHEISSQTEIRKPGRKRPTNNRNNSPSTQSNYSDVVTETVNTSKPSNKEFENYDKYLETNIKNDTSNNEYTSTYSQPHHIDFQSEVVTETVGTEYPNIQAGKLTKFEYYEPTSHDVSNGQFGLQQNEENLPLEHLFIRTEPNNYESTTAAPVSTIVYANNITPTRTTIKISKSQEVSKAIITASSSTTAQPPVSTTKAHHRIRPLRYGNATRPRFSVKDYKTRMDLKNKIAQSSGSTTEQSVRKRPTSQRNISHLTTSEANPRETTGRYKYMSRVSYKTSTTPASVDSDNENSYLSTTEKTKFTPKRRMNANLYRRFPSSKPNAAEGVTIQNNSRSENVLSPVRRRLPGSKTSDKTGEKRGSVTEMAAEETSFYSQPTTTQYTESVNEIALDKEGSQTTINQNNNELLRQENVSLEEFISPTTTTELTSKTIEDEPKLSNNGEQTNSEVASATPYDARLEEELFAKASQSVADLTSSASALYNKPGLFKAVASGQENRKSKNKLQITTEEPTLPIEAFFQELSKKLD